MKKNAIIEMICCLLILMLLYASVSKYVQFRVFVADMHKQPFPGWFTTLLIWSLPPVEIVLAGLLMFDKSRLWGLYGSFFLMLTFLIYTFMAVFRLFDKVPCGCGGIIRTLTWKQHLFFNLFFALVSLLGILLMIAFPAKPTDNKLIHIT